MFNFNYFVFNSYLGNRQIHSSAVLSSNNRHVQKEILSDDGIIMDTILADYCIKMLAKMYEDPKLEDELKEQFFESEVSKRVLISEINVNKSYWIISSFTFSKINTFESHDRVLGKGIIGSMRLGRFELAGLDSSVIDDIAYGLSI